MKGRNQGFYTIGSSGHEGNAAYGLAFKATDMAFLHYRSCAFMLERGRQVPGETLLYDILLSFAASSDDPTSGGRHKVLGSKRLNIPPQTSTIASHLPKAVGAALSIPLTERLSLASNMPTDSVVLCNFGDASANHASALSAINSACWAAYQQVPMPLVFICEDNGIGISKDRLDDIFNMFVRVTDMSTGAGLGLYIVKETVERLNGTIQASSEPGVGTKFEVRLPSVIE